MKRLLPRVLGQHDLARLLLIASVVVPVLLSVTEALARPGGGGSLSGASKRRRWRWRWRWRL